VTSNIGNVEGLKALDLKPPNREEPKFLVMGDVFTAEVIETCLDYKRAHEVDEIRMRPHPYESILYYDV
jgi:glutamine synthetase